MEQAAGPGRAGGWRGELSRLGDEVRSADSVAVALWSVFVVVGLVDLYQYYRRGIFGVDFATVRIAARGLVHHRTNWGQFDYLPGCLILVLPLAVIPLRLARMIIYAIQFAGLGYAFWAITRITGRSLGSRGVAGVALVLAVAGQVGVVSNYENFTLLLVPLAAAFFLAIDRGHSTAAAVALGISLTIKPLLLPLLIVFVLHRRWRCVAVSILIPAVLTGVALLLIARTGSPSHLLHQVFATFGSDTTFPVNMSLTGVGRILSVPVWLVDLLRVVTGLACVGVCRRMWLRASGSPGQRAIWLTAPLLVGMIVCFSFAWAYYAVLFLPLVLVALDNRDPGRRLVQLGVALALLFPLLPDLTKGYPAAHPSDVIALCGLLVVLVGTGLVTFPDRQETPVRTEPLDLTSTR
jgi:arabinofuranan 3-O-arabinosyltransferase